MILDKTVIRELIRMLLRIVPVCLTRGKKSNQRNNRRIKTCHFDMACIILTKKRLFDKTNRMNCAPPAPAKTQNSLGIRPQSLLSAWRNIGPIATYWVLSDQNGRMPRLIWVFAGHTGHFVGFVMHRLIYISAHYNLTDELKFLLKRIWLREV